MARYTLRVNKGATYRLSVVWRGPLLNPYNGSPAPLRAGKVLPGPPISLEGCSAQMQIRRSVSAPEPLLTLTSADGDISLSAPDAEMRGWVRAVTSSNVALSGKQTVDGVKLVEWDRVLVRAQTTAANNGVYVVHADAWERAEEFNSANELSRPASVYVAEGTAFSKTVWRQENVLTSLTAQDWQRLEGVGEILIEMTPEQTAGLESGVYDFEIVTADGVVTRLLEGKVRVSSEVTRDE